MERNANKHGARTQAGCEADVEQPGWDSNGPIMNMAVGNRAFTAVADCVLLNNFNSLVGNAPHGKTGQSSP